jgi:hypothetical protein
MDPAEYGIADKAYVGCPELICEFKKTKKKKTLSPDELQHNLTLQHYRGRNEHSVGEVVNGKEALCGRWRGSYSLICAIAKLTVHMTTLQERMKGPKYDVYGPWPHFPGAGEPWAPGAGMPQVPQPAAPMPAAPAAASKPRAGDVWFVPARLWPAETPNTTTYGSGWLGHVTSIRPGPPSSVLFRCEGEASAAEMLVSTFMQECTRVSTRAPKPAPKQQPKQHQSRRVTLRVTLAMQQSVFESYPAVLDLYRQHVPNTMSRKTFWWRYFRSKTQWQNARLSRHPA